MAHYQAYISKKFSPEWEKMIEIADTICRDYADQGFKLTVRQLFYQFVAHNHFPADRTWSQLPGSTRWIRDPDGTPNAEPNYKWLGEILNSARLAGKLDWDALEDRTRNLQTHSTWDSAQEILDSAAHSFRFDIWEKQPVMVEVWIEKEALIGVIEPVCKKFRVPYFACRGYTSQSESWRAGRRLMDYNYRGQEAHVLHLGDHDPSGIDMSRDNLSRLEMFSESGDVQLHRLALNMDQVRKYNPPPNPTKMTDSRANTYVDEHGDECWELDALSPPVISALIEKHIDRFIDWELWNEVVGREDVVRKKIETFSKRWKD